MTYNFRDLAEVQSADPETQSRIVRELWKLFSASARHEQRGYNSDD